MISATRETPPLIATLKNALGLGTEPSASELVLGLLVIGVIAGLAWLLGKLVLRHLLARLIESTATTNDDELLARNVPGRLAHTLPALSISSLAPALLYNYPGLANVISVVALIYLIVVVALVIDALLDTVLVISSQYEFSRELPLKSVFQVLKLGVWFMAIMLALSLVLGKSPLTLLAGLGAMTAVLMLVFKDPILGFVAGIQLSSNNMVSVGDWIEMPQHGVDGDVMEIALTTVKIRNFDKTITTVPTQTLINDSFKNWRGMQESGGRRIKRAIVIDLNSVKFCDEAMLERFSRINHIADYLATKTRELESFNSDLDLSSPANGRRLTNVGTFRAYIEAYLRHHPKISQELTLLVRQLKPTEAGLPIEIYVFSTEQRWIEYEGIQADIFDHILAAAPEFDLRVFQNPSGNDLQKLALSS